MRFSLVFANWHVEAKNSTLQGLEGRSTTFCRKTRIVVVSSFAKKVTDFSEQSSGRVPSLVGAY